MQMSRKISGVTGPKFTKFLTGLEESSSMFTQQWTLQYSRQLLNASAQNEKGLNFANTRNKSVTIATSLERAVAISIFYYKADLLFYSS